ncbi:hypothetical protein BJV78DRAFT_1158557 [Lactifluus subvellereus]|nr:hypothetical protein BJV78DRAFT_1158557 [Lactifluus subvellereus]
MTVERREWPTRDPGISPSVPLSPSSPYDRKPGPFGATMSICAKGWTLERCILANEKAAVLLANSIDATQNSHPSATGTCLNNGLQTFAARSPPTKLAILLVATLAIVTVDGAVVLPLAGSSRELVIHTKEKHEARQWANGCIRSIVAASRCCGGAIVEANSSWELVPSLHRQAHTGAACKLGSLRTDCSTNQNVRIFIIFCNWATTVAVSIE